MQNDKDLLPSEDNFSTSNEPGFYYEKAETDLLKEALKRTHQERFYFATALYKIQQTLKKATVTHKPDTLKK